MLFRSTRRDTFLQYLAGFILRNPARILRCIGLPFAVAEFYLGLIDNRQMKESFLSAVLGGIHRQEIEAWTKQYVPQLVSYGLNEKAMDVLRQHRQEDRFPCPRTTSTPTGLQKGPLAPWRSVSNSFLTA